MSPTPAWAQWSPAAARLPWTIGVEEEVMLLDAATLDLAPRIDDVLADLSPALVGHVTGETHASAVELATGVHRTVAGAVAELSELRAALAAELERIGCRVAAAGTHPLQAGPAVVSPHTRASSVLESMHGLARREPTFALHVHVAVPDPNRALRALDGLRAHLPVLLALAGNSPFWQGHDTGLASARVPVFGMFPRVGIPRRFGTWAEYVGAVDRLVACGAIPEPTFLWWDARLQPRFGTLEVRVMDAQLQLADVAALVALVRCLVRDLALAGEAPERVGAAPEVLEENRFLAARDGMQAALIDPIGFGRRSAAAWLDELLVRCAMHASTLGCTTELARVPALAAQPGAERQRLLAGRGSRAELRDMLAALADGFCAPLQTTLTSTA